ncbi:MAG: 4Fe-4S binding protein [Coriobacteriia bacterium]|nr:4Fe-4S binding protein [Coriobacteriia bacterium]
MSWSRLRRIVQIVLLVAFVGLTIGGLGLGSSWAFSSLFSRLDPLVGLSAALASRAFIAFWAAALLTVVLSIALGRVWCGWICPLGTLIELAPLPALLRSKISPRWRLGKYVTLAVVLGAAIVGNLGPMILDPVTIIARPLQELARPFVGNDAVGLGIGATLGRGAVHTVAFLSLIPLVLVIALSLAEHRAWCRDVCPLGGLLGVLSKLPGVRRVVDAETCTGCARCAKACPTDAIARKGGFESSSAECIVCLRCLDACPAGANAFGAAPPKLLAPAYQPARRDALIAVGATGLGVVAVVLPIERADADILRPPSTTPARLAELCVRCGACYSACPTGSLRPSVSFATEAGPWTPMLDERPAHCTMNCNRCAVPCPTDAIHTPTQSERIALGLGVRAEIDKTRCRAWANNHACMQCQSTCPISGALVGVERPANLPSRRGGPPVEVPVVNTELCVGCNQCAPSCAMTPAAIGSPLPKYDPGTIRPQMPPPGVTGMPGSSGSSKRTPTTE